MPSSIHPPPLTLADCVCRDPLKAVAAAFGAGVVLSLLPLRPVVGGVVRAVFKLAGPSLLYLGAMKVRDFCRAQDTDTL